MQCLCDETRLWPHRRGGMTWNPSFNPFYLLLNYEIRTFTALFLITKVHITDSTKLCMQRVYSTTKTNN